MSSDRIRPTNRGSVRVAAIWLLVALLCVCGCKSRQAAPKPTPAEDKLMVFAAASLRGAFTSMGEEFKRGHPNVMVEFNFAGTQELRTQLEQGADADVFASADQRHMAELVKAAHVGPPAIFARNEPVLAVSKESAEKISAFADLPSATRIIIGTPEVPIGRYTLQILDRASKSLGPDFRARVQAHVISRELNVRQIYAKVSVGEADVGVVYRTDVQGTANGVKLVPIPAECNVVAEYPIAVVTNAKHPALAKSWVKYVLSAEGRQALQKVGFTLP
jgi:molybdate transport system substrate-binding protein